MLQYQSGDPEKKKEEERGKAKERKHNQKTCQQVIIPWCSFSKTFISTLEHHKEGQQNSQRFLKVPMPPDVMFKTLTTGTAQVLISQHELWQWAIHVALLVQSEWTPALHIYLPPPDFNLDLLPSLFPQALTHQQLLQFHPGQLLISPSSSTPFPPDPPLPNPKKLSDNIGPSLEGSDQKRLSKSRSF